VSNRTAITTATVVLKALARFLARQGDFEGRQTRTRRSPGTVRTAAINSGGSSRFAIRPLRSYIGHQFHRRGGAPAD